MNHMDADKAHEEKTRQQLHKNISSCIEKILEAALHKTVVLWPPITHLEDHPG